MRTKNKMSAEDRADLWILFLLMSPILLLCLVPVIIALIALGADCA